MLNPLILLASAALVTAQDQDYDSGRPVRAATPQVAPQGVPASRSLQAVPNITIKYYDVSGKDVRTINRSIAKQRPIDPVTKKPSIAGTNWTLGASMTKRTTNGRCTVVAAKGEFAATAELPRLTTASVLPAAASAEWQSYVARLEQAGAANLWFVYDRLPEVEKAMVGQECEAALKAGTEAIEQLKRDAADFQRKNAAGATLK